jgi:hypothetical protein
VAETKIPEGSVKRHLNALDGQRFQRVSVNGLAGGRGHQGQWALLAETVQINRSPLSKEEVNGFSLLTQRNRSEEITKPFKTVQDERFRGDEDEGAIPF